MDRLIKPDKKTFRASKPAPDTINEALVPDQLSQTLTLTPHTYASIIDTGGDTADDTQPDTAADMEPDTPLAHPGMGGGVSFLEDAHA
ncbi:hypothetical protein NXS08_03155 [Gleimia sp. 6138-11-ORH1]|uniref:hypothetical protein n=1 Tax=Gleimia sp. 6138-11-ORH1 TaxID=2973937 RepID=UPI002167E569|nr:hypothetical protein [Gleimia sp. 6138-11-ORH1]MCS4484487.1 hypothetical protein [Gleimia sp. 6138-11-ORH1]